MSDLAAVFAVTSCKGGCCKSTTVLILAGEYAAQGYRVHIIDADPKKRLLKWAGLEPEIKDPPMRADGYLKTRSAVADNITVSRGAVDTLVAEISKARSVADIVLIDVEGTANLALVRAVDSANAVVIPATLSFPDIEDGLATVELIKDMEITKGRTIPHGFLFSNVQSAIRSREMISLEAQVVASGVHILGRVFNRTAFASLFSFGATLDDLPPSEVSGIEKAKADAIRLTDAIGLLLSTAISNADEAAA